MKVVKLHSPMLRKAPLRSGKSRIAMPALLSPAAAACELSPDLLSNASLCIVFIRSSIYQRFTRPRSGLTHTARVPFFLNNARGVATITVSELIIQYINGYQITQNR